ncbi:hypothetical protein HF086_015219 [Spodoptera exigua]|uniref:Uncharacterized protein n=1 Tax=Spodoptera exigua TaxID=7107 RepID=A0A922SK88_SPOEX|nr:hypothetical protein HF086_015219 [Spodoptera exigua]
MTFTLRLGCTTEEVIVKGASKERQEMRRTGGGPPPAQPSGFCSDATDWLREIIPSSIDGNMAIFDDDVIYQKPTVFPAKKMENILDEVVEDNTTEESHLPKKPRSENIIIEVVEDMTEEAHLQNKIPDNGKTNEATNNEKWDFDPSTPPTALSRDQCHHH